MSNNNKALKVKSTKAQVDCVDIFCGIGGLTHGLINGGIKVKAGYDLDLTCKFAFEKNNKAKFIQKDVKEIKVSDLRQFYGKDSVSMLAGCAPCQPFSTYSRTGRSERNDNKWDLLISFGALVRKSKPHLVTMENVPELSRHKVFQLFLKDLKGYHVDWKIIDCTEYGIPQTRKRLVLIASRIGAISLWEPKRTKIKTVREAISHLPPIEAGESDASDNMHSSCALSELNLKRIKASSPGGSWRDWDPDIVAECHRKDSGSTYPSVYGRMEWDAPSPTITTQCFGFGNGRFGHPDQDRAISLREAAILQTFPDDYVFLKPEEKVVFNKIGR
ncbi:MAG: DNA cytosine methyltransferase, partial [Flavobacterium sp.]